MCRNGLSESERERENQWFISATEIKEEKGERVIGVEWVSF